MPKIFEKLDKIRPAYDMIYKITLFVCKMFLIADIIITCYSVIGRYVPAIGNPSWSEEIILTLMSYMVVLSAALAIRKDSHIRMTVFDNYLPSAVVKILNLLADIAILYLAYVMITSGWTYATIIGSKGTYVTLPGLSRSWKYYPVPLAGVAMVIFEIEKIYEHIKAFWVKEEKK